MVETNYFFTKLNNWCVKRNTIMEKLGDWYQWLNLPKEKKSSYIGIVIDDKNIVHAYAAGEEKKYKAALKKQQTKLNAENLLS